MKKHANFNIINEPTTEIDKVVVGVADQIMLAWCNASRDAGLSTDHALAAFATAFSNLPLILADAGEDAEYVARTIVKMCESIAKRWTARLDDLPTQGEETR